MFPDETLDLRIDREKNGMSWESVSEYCYLEDDQLT